MAQAKFKEPGMPGRFERPVKRQLALIGEAEELGPVAPTPAASGPADGGGPTEQECLRMLVKVYGWVWVGSHQLQRFSRHKIDPKAIFEARENG